MCLPYNIKNNLYRLIPILRTMDDYSILCSVVNKSLKIFIEMLDYIRADGVCTLTSFPPIGQGCERGHTSIDAPLGVGI